MLLHLALWSGALICIVRFSVAFTTSERPEVGLYLETKLSPMVAMENIVIPNCPVYKLARNISINVVHDVLRQMGAGIRENVRPKIKSRELIVRGRVGIKFRDFVLFLPPINPNMQFHSGGLTEVLKEYCCLGRNRALGSGVALIVIRDRYRGIFEHRAHSIWLNPSSLIQPHLIPSCSNAVFGSRSTLNLGRSLMNGLIHRPLSDAFFAIDGIERVGSKIRGSRTSFGCNAHLLQLAGIGMPNSDIDEDGGNSDSDKHHLTCLNILLQLSGSFIVMVGIPISGWGWWVLITRRLSWRLKMRVYCWLLANALAGVFFWHGMSIMSGF